MLPLLSFPLRSSFDQDHWPEFKRSVRIPRFISEKPGTIIKTDRLIKLNYVLSVHGMYYTNTQTNVKGNCIRKISIYCIGNG